MRLHRVLIVTRKSLYQLYVNEHKEEAIERALNRADPATLLLKKSHDANLEALEQVQDILRERGIESVARWRARCRSTRRFDLVISLGGDGTLIDISHRIEDTTPLLGINSDPERSVGALCCGPANQLPELLDGLEAGTLHPEPVNRIRARLDGEPVLGPTLNDVLFAHECPAGLTRFDLALSQAAEAATVGLGRQPELFHHYRGSGLWVSTAIGSTAAIHSAGGHKMPPLSSRLQYLVREPYIAPNDGATLNLRGFLAKNQMLVLLCRLRRGTLWADGVHRSVNISYGQQIIIDNHPVPLRLVLCRP